MNPAELNSSSDSELRALCPFVIPFMIGALCGLVSREANGDPGRDRACFIASGATKSKSFTSIFSISLILPTKLATFSVNDIVSTIFLNSSTAIQASYFALPTTSQKAGRACLHGPSVACLKYE
uniref:CSON009253 protein n=1 Tax=Culicoides sonorensis TaxID=179676 RepID=A0A336M003_CULSO